MPKTRQQRLAEERAGHPSSPPKFLEDKPRGPKRTRAKTPSATVAAGPVVPVARPAVPGEPQALLLVWVDAAPEASGLPVNAPNHRVTIPSSLVPELVAYIENIRNQKTQDEMAEFILPKQPEPAKNQTAKKLPNGRKSAFRRNPLLPASALFKAQPVEASLDTSAADGITFLQADTRSTQEALLTPEASRSNWSIGNLISSARSIKSHFGFGPLVPVSESPDSFPQTPTPNSAQRLAGETAPAEPKKKGTLPTSARDARAKNRRHNNSVLKPVRSTTAPKNQRNRPPRAGEGIPAPGGTVETSAEGEEIPNTRSSNQIEGEPRQAQIQEPTAESTIRWPSRSLDRMNQRKRKRWDEPVAMPTSESGSHGLGETDLYGDSDEDGTTKEQPGKIRRTRGSQRFSSQVAGDHNTARQYTPPKAQHSATGYQGGNVFAEYEAVNTGQLSLQKTPIPITNPTGTFKVPSPGDDEWSDSGSEEEEGNSTGLEDINPSRNQNGEFASGNTRVWPPKPPQPLPTQAEALQKARAKFLKHKPRVPSRLSQSARAYPSPPVPGEVDKRQSELSPPHIGDFIQRQSGPEAAVTRDSEQDGRTNFTAFADWCATASPAVRAALESMEVDSNVAGNVTICVGAWSRPHKPVQLV